MNQCLITLGSGLILTNLKATDTMPWKSSALRMN
jgi:hypothetical protein